MRVSLFLFVPLVIGLLAFGCASDQSTVEKRLSSFREDITHLQAENDRLTERIDALEAKQVAPAPAPAAPAASGSAASGRVERPPLKVVRLEPGGEEEAVNEDGSPAVAPEERPDAPGTRPVIRLTGKAPARSRDREESASADRPLRVNGGDEEMR